MNRGGIVHSGLMVSLRRDFYPSCCTIQERTEVQSSTGHATYTWSDLDCHVGLACRIAPASTGTQGRGQIDVSDETYELRTYDIAINGRYPDITAVMRVLADDGQLYDIVRVDHDDQSAMTVLRCKQVQ